MEDGDDDETNELAIQAMDILHAGSDATNKFFMRVGEEILAFGKKNDLTINEMAVNLGWLGGTFALTAMRSDPDRYIEAGNIYVNLCQAAVELGAARARIMQEDTGPKPPKPRRKRGGPTNG
jgi:hypothetical protein